MKWQNKERKRIRYNNKTSVPNAVVLQVITFGQSVGESLGSCPVFDLQVLNLSTDDIVRDHLEVLVTQMGHLNEIGWVDRKAGLKISGGQNDRVLEKSNRKLRTPISRSARSAPGHRFAGTLLKS